MNTLESSGEVEATLPAKAGTQPSSAAESVAPLSRGRLVGRYVILEQLGSGGMGVVYRAYDPELDRAVALKLLHRDDRGPTGEARLLREAQAMARLSHPNVIVVHDVGTHEGQVFLAMEYVDGQTLKEWIVAEDHDWRAVLDVFGRAGEGLAAAHRAQFVHRDFKPDNVLIGSDGRLRVLDFGLVHFTGSESEEVEPLETASSTLSLSLTKTGAVMGTPSYMSPEQVAGKTATERSDQFSFCVALYEGLYREKPFRASSPAELAAKITGHDVPDPPSGSSVPGWVRRVVVRGLAKSPDDRHPDMATLLEQLRRNPGRWRSRVLLVVGVVGLSLGTGLVAASVADEDEAPCTGAPTHMAEVWSDAQRERVNASFVDTGLSYATSSADAATSQLDAYAAEWIDLHEQACLAGVRGESSARLLDLQMSCLDGRLASMRSVIDALADADEKTIRNSPRVLATLPPLPRCADAVSLQAELAPPEDPERVPEFERLRAELIDNNVQRNAGKYDAASKRAKELLAETREFGHDPLLVDALHEAGYLAEDLGELDRAYELLEEAYILAIETRRDRRAASAAATIGTVLGIRQGKWEAASPWNRTALALVRRIAPGSVEEADVLDGIAEELRIKGDLEGAERHARRAHEIAVARVGERTPKAAESARHLAFIVMQKGSPEEALPLAQLSLDVNTEVNGPEHPDVAGSLAVVGIVLGALDRNQEQLEILQRSVAISTKLYGRRSRAVASALVNMSNAARMCERYDEARSYIEEAMGIYVELFGEDHPKVGGAHVVFGDIEEVTDHLEEARKHYLRGLDIMKSHYGDEHPNVVGALQNLAAVHVREKNLPQALEVFENAAAIGGKVFGEGHPNTLTARTDYAATMLELGRSEEAVVVLRDVLKQRILGPEDPRGLVQTRFTLARALWAVNERAEALELARAATRVYDEHPEIEDATAEDLRAWLESRA